MFNESSLGKNTKHEKYRTLFASEYQMADNLFGKTDDRKNTDFQMEEMTRTTQKHKNTKLKKYRNSDGRDDIFHAGKESQACTRT